MDESIRELVIQNVVETVRDSGMVRGVTDEEPWDYLRPDVPHAWVFEGDEIQDSERFAGKTECILSVHIHQTYHYRPGDHERDLYKLGRRLLAQYQRLMLTDIKRGGAAWLTLEQKNSIGRPAETEAAVGIVATEWAVKYRRDFFNPYKR